MSLKVQVLSAAQRQIEWGRKATDSFAPNCGRNGGGNGRPQADIGRTKHLDATVISELFVRAR